MRSLTKIFCGALLLIEFNRHLVQIALRRDLAQELLQGTSQGDLAHDLLQRSSQRELAASYLVVFLFSSGRESVGLSPAFGFCLGKLFSGLKWQTVEGQSPKMVFHVFFPGVVWRFIVWCGFSQLSRGSSRFWHAPGGKK